MTSSSGPRLVAPGRLLGATWALVLLHAVTRAVVALAGGRGDPWRGAVHVAAVLALGAMWALVAARAERPDDEQLLWRRAASAFALVGTGVLAADLLALSPRTAAASPLVAAVAVAAAFPPLYRALVRWNRTATTLADPDDLLNGVGSVLALVAVLAAVAHGTGLPVGRGPWWTVLAQLLPVSCTFVLLGTVASMASIAQLARDARIWLLAGAFTAWLVEGAVHVATVGSPTVLAALSGDLLGTAGLGLFALAVALRPRRTDPVPTDPTVSTVGSFVVIVASVALLGVAATRGTPPLSTWLALSGAALAGTRMLVNVRDLAALAVARREALTDDVTELGNRRGLDRRLGELRAAGAEAQLVLIDLRRFREVNDGLGHSAGDRLLRQVGARLRTSAGPAAFLARLSGDEFAVLAPLTGDRPEDAAAVTARFAAAFADPYDVGGVRVHVSARYGVADTACGAASQLLRRADAALSVARASGSDCVVHDLDRHAGTGAVLGLAEELRTALATDQLVLHYQPQLSVDGGELAGVEALVRWAHPVRGLLAPDVFLPVAESHGLMAALTDSVLDAALRQASAWARAGRPLRVSVNLSASSLLDVDLPARVASLLAVHGLPPGALVLEVTESVMLADAGGATAVVDALAELGVPLSIDDFGTGYCSLTYLRSLPVTELKLDRTFTADLLTDDRAAAIVASTIDLAHALGLRVVAEGVESEAVLDRLRALACDESQGYLHSRPVPAPDLAAWLEGGRSGAARGATADRAARA